MDAKERDELAGRLMGAFVSTANYHAKRYGLQDDCLSNMFARFWAWMDKNPNRTVVITDSSGAKSHQRLLDQTPGYIAGRVYRNLHNGGGDTLGKEWKEIRKKERLAQAPHYSITTFDLPDNPVEFFVYRLAARSNGRLEAIDLMGLLENTPANDYPVAVALLETGTPEGAATLIAMGNQEGEQYKEAYQAALRFRNTLKAYAGVTNETTKARRKRNPHKSPRSQRKQAA
jgi:hypothetical protein